MDSGSLLSSHTRSIADVMMLCKNHNIKFFRKSNQEISVVVAFYQFFFFYVASYKF